jgi:hypothetical protein
MLRIDGELLDAWIRVAIDTDLCSRNVVRVMRRTIRKCSHRTRHARLHFFEMAFASLLVVVHGALLLAEVP